MRVERDDLPMDGAVGELDLDARVEGAEFGDGRGDEVGGEAPVVAEDEFATGAAGRGGRCQPVGAKEGRFEGPERLMQRRREIADRIGEFSPHFPGDVNAGASMSFCLESIARLGRVALAAAMFAVVAKVAAGASPLSWDAKEKTVSAKEGETEVQVAFTVTNATEQPVTITAVATSCHCTAAQPPRSPWVIAPGQKDELRATVDIKGKSGELTKTIFIYTDRTGDAPEVLLVHLQLPLTREEQRELNMQFAQANRQAVLHGECASCHVEPAVGKKGAELFLKACLICHGGEHRASMVPDLAVAKEKRDAAFWEKWIREGKEKTLMPAFAKDRGGFLDDEQVKSLVEYLVATMAAEPVAK